METIELFRNATDFKSFSAGQSVFSEGDPGDVAYAVKQGEVEIVVRDRVIDRVGAGGLVGEMALVDHQPRSAAVRATTDCQLVPIDQKRFQFMVQQTPFFAIQVMRIMAARLRKLMEVQSA